MKRSAFFFRVPLFVNAYLFTGGRELDRENKFAALAVKQTQDTRLQFFNEGHQIAAIMTNSDREFSREEAIQWAREQHHVCNLSEADPPTVKK